MTLFVLLLSLPSIVCSQNGNPTRISCGTNKFCYSVDLYPHSGTIITSPLINISSTSENIVETFDIEFTSNGYDCINPSITVLFEEIDYWESWEYFDVRDESGRLIKRCSGTEDENCGLWKTCLKDRNLGIGQIDTGAAYTMSITTSEGFNLFCSHSFNTQLSLKCSPPTVSPSYNPTMNPSSDPSVSPTTEPTLNPTLPTIQPSTPPTVSTLKPTELSSAPTSTPSAAPSTDTLSPTEITVYPTSAPWFNPSQSPSESPNVKTILVG